MTLSQDLFLVAMSAVSGRAARLRETGDQSDYAPKLRKIWDCMLDQSQKSDRVEAWDDNQLYDTCKAMQAFGGAFAQNIAAAWYVADSTNRVLLQQAFVDLFIKYGPTRPTVCCCSRPLSTCSSSTGRAASSTRVRPSSSTTPKGWATDMRTIYAVSTESESSGAVDWYPALGGAEHAYTEAVHAYPNEETTLFEFKVDNGMSGDEITDLVDEIMWGTEHLIDHGGAVHKAHGVRPLQWSILGS